MMNIGKYLIAIFFLMMLVVPTTLQAPRGVLLGIIVLGAMSHLIFSSEDWKVDKTIINWLLVCIGYSLLAMLNGIYRGAPGAIAVGTVYVVWPVLYIFLAGFSAKIETYVLLQKTLLLGILLAALSGLLLIASSFYPFLNIFDPFFELLGGGLGIYEGTIEYRLTSMTTVIYGFGFLICTLISSSRSKENITSRWSRTIYVLLMVLLIVTLILSGRRVFLFISAVSIPMSLIYLHLSELKKIDILDVFRISISYVLAVIAIACTLYFTLDIDYQLIWDNFIAGFDFSDAKNISAVRRSEQFQAMIAEWLDTPLLGAGHGAAASDNLGSEEMAWAYELQYVALLFQTGIFGIVVYSSAVGWLIYQMIRLSRLYRDLAQLMVPMLVGLTSFLIANATNPYLSKFDYLWTIFFPVALVNIGLLREKYELQTCSK